MAELTLDAFKLPFQYEVSPVENSLTPDITETIDYKVTGIDSFISDINDSSRWEFIEKWPMIVLSIPNVDASYLNQSLQSVPDTLHKSLHYIYIDEVKAPMMNYDFESNTFSTERVHATHLRSGMNQTFIPPHVQRYIQIHKLYGG
jgi:hypothetical protein